MLKNQKKDYSLPTIVTQKCLICETSFSVKRKTLWSGGGKYCSRKCLGQANSIIQSLLKQKNRVEKQCKVCSKLIYIKPSHSYRNGTTCSMECYGKYLKIYFKGKRNPNYKHGYAKTNEYQNWHSHTRRALREPKDKIDLRAVLEFKAIHTNCYWCGIRFTENNKINLDHYEPLSKGGDNKLSNIVASCKSCNSKKHAIDPFKFAQSRGRLL